MHANWKQLSPVKLEPTDAEQGTQNTTITTISDGIELDTALSADLGLDCPIDLQIDDAITMRVGDEGCTTTGSFGTLADTTQDDETFLEIYDMPSQRG